MMLSKSWCWLVVEVLVWVAVAVAEKRDINLKKITAVNNQVVQQLETSLLSSFGLTRRPTVKMDIVVPPYMLELFHRHQAGENDVAKAEHDESPSKTLASSSYNTARSFTHEESNADGRYPVHKMRLRFSLSNLPSEEVLHSAELRLTFLKHSNAPDYMPEEKFYDINLRRRKRRRWTTNVAPYLKRIMVYDILRSATRFSEPTLRLLDTGVVDVRQMGVQAMDVSDAVRRWIVAPKSNNGLLIEIVAFTKSTLDASNVQLRRSARDKDGLSNQPLLIVYTSDEKAKIRTRRSVVNKHKKTRETCRRHRLHVDFRQVGWDDWIVAPSGYDAYFCKGECQFPLQDSLNTTNHAVVQTLVNSRYPDRVPRACCVPTELSPISMLYVDDDNNFVLKNHQDMVVEGCGCR